MPDLSDQDLEALRARNGGKVGVIKFDEHQMVFKRPARDTAREYRTERDNPATAPDALDHLAQRTIIAFDGETNGEKARLGFNALLADNPLITDNTNFKAVLSCMLGTVEQELEDKLGEPIRILRGNRKPSQEASPTG